jgi:hypothetical protein
MSKNDKNCTPAKLILKRLFTKVPFFNIKLTSRDAAQTPNCPYRGQWSFKDEYYLQIHTSGNKQWSL